MYVLYTLILVCPNVAYAKTRVPRNTPGTVIFVMAEINPISFQKKSLNYTSHQTQISIQVPQVIVADKTQKDLNRYLLNNAKMHMHQMIKENKKINKDLRKDDVSLFPFEYNESFNEIKSIDPYHTLEIFKYEYKGGAHGLGVVQHLTYSTKEQRLIELKDLFKEKIDYKTLINTYIQKQIVERTSKGETFFRESEGFQGIQENQDFFINAYNELVIVFNTYEIAPYSSGILYFSIPIKEIQAYMK